MESFTPVSALAGGLMIGAATAALLLLNGRIAGVSGILGGLLQPSEGEAGWRVAFLLGLVLGPLLHGLVAVQAPITITPSLPVLVAGGLLVGFGTRLGAGCTSGHGVCGIARLSPRSLVATATFMVVAVATVLVRRQLFGGLS
jgi:uncharacterized membrane protein YedE/YeeE